MKMLIWAVAGVLALLWTGAAGLTAWLVEWSGRALASGTAEAAGRALSQEPLPPWLALWVDPAWLKTLQETLRWLLDVSQGLLPTAGTALGWLVPMVWAGWGLGLVLLLVLALLAHLAVARWRPPALRPAAA